jgi:hypothetical protein
MKTTDILIFLLLFGMANAALPAQLPNLPAGEISNQIESAIGVAQGILFAFIILFVIFGVLVFMFGQFLGADTRARVNVYTTNILGAILVAVFLFVLTPYVIQWLIPPGLYTDKGTYAGQLYAIAIAFLSVVLAAMALILARVLDLKQLEQTAKSELVYAASTVFIVAALIVMMGFFEKIFILVATDLFTNIYGSKLLQADPNFVLGLKLTDIAKLYLAAPQECMRTAMATIKVIAVPIEALASVFMEIFMSEQASGFVFKFFSERINNLAKILTFFQWASYLVFHMLNFIKHYAMLFLGVGVALRSFPPTRGAGAYLIALCLGLYLIFPFSYILLSTLVSNFTFDKDVYTQNALPSGKIGYVCKLPEVPDTIQYCGITRPESIFELKNWMRANRDSVISFLDYVSGDLVKSISLSVCFLPIMALTITLSFVLSTTSLFGGQIPEIGRGLIKII